MVVQGFEPNFGEATRHLFEYFQKEELLKVIGYIDLTTLAGDDTKDRVTALLDRAVAPYAKVFLVKKVL